MSREPNEAILTESHLREGDQQAVPDTYLERRTSAQTTIHGEPPD